MRCLWLRHAFKTMCNSILVVLITIIVTYVTYEATVLFCESVPVETSIRRTSELRQRLHEVSEEFETLKRQHTSLRLSWRGRQKQKYLEYEELRRYIYTNTRELWTYINRGLTSSDGNVTIKTIRDVFHGTYLRKTKLLSALAKFQTADAWSDWRERESARVSQLVQNRLHHLQYPENCRTTKKLFCHRVTTCNFGCQIHHIVYCLIFAYATERTMILVPLTQAWQKEILFPSLLHPLTHCCFYYDEYSTSVQWEGDNNPKAIQLFWKKQENFTPLSVPSDLGHIVKRFNGDPASWWVGQVLRFILNPCSDVQAVIDDKRSSINFNIPIVGIHVRRTDKRTEASFHRLEEYMRHVKDYYDQLELTTPVSSRRVYVATDAIDLLEEARRKYPEYEFLGNKSVAESAQPKCRQSPSSVIAMLVDLYMLSMCDYVIATFSSQMGRAAYEIMQANRIDASNSFFSLDDIYYFAGQIGHNRSAVIPHRSENMSFEEGDLIGVAGNHWNGYGIGTNFNTKQYGLFPWYKTSDVLEMVRCPEYKEVTLNLATDSFSSLLFQTPVNSRETAMFANLSKKGHTGNMHPNKQAKCDTKWQHAVPVTNIIEGFNDREIIAFLKRRRAKANAVLKKNIIAKKYIHVEKIMNKQYKVMADLSLKEISSNQQSDVEWRKISELAHDLI